MTLYQLSARTYRPGGYAAATGFGPVANMWFLGPKFLERRQAYWKVNPKEPGLIIEANARAWPDFLNNGHSPPMFFISDLVLQSLQAIDALLGRITEMPIAEIRAKALKNKPVPRYFVVETIPGIEVDLEATGFKLDRYGKPNFNLSPSPWPSPYRYRLDSWNGADLFAYRYFGLNDGPYTEMLCTERVKELAEKKGWTNARFEPLVLV